MKQEVQVSYYHRHLETMTREEIEEYQWRRLKRQLEYLWGHNAFYRERMEQQGISPGDIKSREDFCHKIPLMRKRDAIEDQEAFPPYGKRLGVSPQELSVSYLTSGTSGQGREAYGATEFDEQVFANRTSTHLYWMGARPGDVIFLFFPMGVLAGGIHATRAAARLGLHVFQCGTLDTKTRIEYMQRFQPKFLMTTPMYLNHLTIEIQKAGLVPRRDLSVKAIMSGAGSYPISWALNMEETWGAKLFERYSSTQGGTMASSCEMGVTKKGGRGYLHLCEAYAYVEILNPQTGEPVNEGEAGEVVVTPLQQHASPVLRFATADKVVYSPSYRCPCGRTWRSIQAGTVERYDDMIKMKAMNVWPAAVDNVIFGHSVAAEYQGRVVVDEDGKEEVIIALEYSPGLPPEQRSSLLQQIASQLKEKTGVRMKVEEAPSGSLPRFEYKARRWKDERGKGLEK